MRIVLFRHGHKQFSMDENPSLSLKGFDQSKKLTQMLDTKILPNPNECWHSFKKRTFETLQELKLNPSIQFKLKNNLNERQATETIKDFQNRIKLILIDIQNLQIVSKEHILFICSHYDWIEEFLNIASCSKDLNAFEYSNWAPGQYLDFEFYDDQFHILHKGVL